MDIRIVDVVGDDDLDRLWELYCAALDDIRAEAVQRQLMYHREFVDVMRDRRVRKYLCFDDGGGVQGVAAFTNHLDASPMIAPQYFERHWPAHYRARKIWYIMFNAVHPRAPGGTFRALVEAMYRVAIDEGGIVGLDMCSYSEMRELPRDLRMLVDSLTADVRAGCIDRQATWLYEFPQAEGARR